MYVCVFCVHIRARAYVSVCVYVCMNVMDCLAPIIFRSQIPPHST